MQSSVSFASVANITQIGFTTPARSVALGVVSESLVLQTQNAGGTSEQLDETSDLTLSSSSATGEFSSSATTWTPDTILTMSKNSSNRTFYYKDSVDGTYTITATVLTRTTLKTWTTTQTIIVGTGGSGGGAGGDTALSVTATSTTATSTTSSSLSASTSAHSGGTSVARDPEPKEFEIFGGRDRLVVVGAPVVFQAKIALIKNVSNPTRYLWSFGDGSAHDGIKTEHTYLFPGEYVVVLNAEAFEGNAVWRGVVKVVAPELVINASSTEYIEIANRSAFEINLNNWSIRNGQESFTFPIDTIIPARKKVAFPYQITKVTSGPNVSANLHNPSGKLVAHWQAPVVAQATKTSSVVLAINLGMTTAGGLNSLDTADATYQKAIALSSEWDREHGAVADEVLMPRVLLTRSVAQPAKIVVQSPSNASSAGKSKNEQASDSNQTASVITILPEEATSTSRGFIDTLISWPGRSLRFMRDLIF